MTKWLKVDQENPRIGTANAVARLMSFAQITFTSRCASTPSAFEVITI